MIQMDESEYKAAAVDDDTLRLICAFNGHEVKDKLLYEGDAYGRCTRDAPSVLQRGDHLELRDRDHTSVSEAEGRPA